jgi:hypothetical protein
MEKLKLDRDPISRQAAIKLCKQVIQDHRTERFKLYKISYWQCWGCQRFGNKDGSFDNICALNAEGNRGCRQVNKLFDSRKI